MVYDARKMMRVLMKKYESVLDARCRECDEGGHKMSNKKRNKCEYCFRSLDYGSRSGLELSVVKLGEKFGALQMIVKERDEFTYRKYMESFFEEKKNYKEIKRFNVFSWI